MRVTAVVGSEATLCGGDFSKLVGPSLSACRLPSSQFDPVPHSSHCSSESRIKKAL